MAQSAQRSLMLGMVAVGLLCGCTNGKLLGNVPTTDGPARLDGGGGPIADLQTPPPRDGGPVAEMSEPACNACHGSDQNAAPPRGMGGESSTSSKAVGAHQAHLGSSTWHAPLHCSDCHVVPQSYVDPGHLDTALPAELTFSTLCRIGGATPVWDGTTCSGTYCHGATLDGGAHRAPTWTKVDGTQKACGSCHGMPPGGTHTTNPACSTCHGSVVDASNTIIAANLHIDGTLQFTGGHSAGYEQGSVHGGDFLRNPSSCQAPACHGNALTGPARSCDSCHSGWRTNCTFCHGGRDNTTGAPPEDVAGNTTTTTRAVGPHTEHVTQTNHPAYSCATCHNANYTDVLDPGHLGPSPGDVDLTGISGGSASYDSGTGTCSNIYCHGDGNGADGSATFGSGTISGCSACHDDGTRDNGKLDEAHDKHVRGENMQCVDCHQCVVDGSMNITAPALHVDGNKDFCPKSWVGFTNDLRCSPTDDPRSNGDCHGGDSERW